jgi:outer membrane protein assembly factor BamD (BamD/ComL family)
LRSIGSTITACVLVVSGCSFHNVIYNAQRLSDEADRLRREGHDSLSAARYEDVTRKTGQALKARPASNWEAEALFLLGRSRLRLNDLPAARAALEEADRRTQDEKLRSEVQVYVAMTHMEMGDPVRALELVDRSLSTSLDDNARAEGLRLRGRILLSTLPGGEGWEELDRSSVFDSELRVEVGLERLRWAIKYNDRDRTHRALKGLLSYPEGANRLDSILSMVDEAERKWGPAQTAELLVDADSSSWGRTARGKIALERARWLDTAGDTAAAAEQAWRVAAGLGVTAAEARLLLSSWRLERARNLDELRTIRAILLPAGEDLRVLNMLESIDRLEAFTTIGLDESLGWFAAAEVARESLDANYLARGLFLAYVDGAREEPWAPKALLAALEASPDEGDRAWLRGRLEAYGDSPYVLASHGRSAAGFELLEEGLEVRLRELARQ